MARNAKAKVQQKGKGLVVHDGGKHGAVAAAAPADDPMLTMIDRAIRDRSIDLDRIKALMDMRRDAERAQAERDFDDAMNLCQRQMEPIRAGTKNDQTRSKYATHVALDRAIRPIYTQNGFSVGFDTDASPLEQHVRVVAIVSRGGVSRTRHVDMPADGKGAKGGDVMTKTHATMSAITYGKRGLLSMIFNLAIYGTRPGEDDDGNAAGGRPAAADEPKITQEQAAALAESIKWCGVGEAKFCARYEIKSVADLPARMLGDAKLACQNYHEAQEAKKAEKRA